ncbi:MAG: outer membrane beta-barrel protein [Betaproteobacteria bacterium]|jgi:OOP family OmpA-OmpF porin
MHAKTVGKRRALVPTLATLLLGLAGWNAQGQSFVGLSAGTSRADIDCTGALTCDRNGTAWKLYGGYMFHPNFGAQAEIYRQGHARFSASLTDGTVVNGELKGEGIGLYGLAVARDGIWSVFGKAGVLTSRMSGTLRVADLGNSQRETHTHLGWGAGVGVDWTKNFGARLEFERLRGRLQGESVDVDQVTAGIVARF